MALTTEPYASILPQAANVQGFWRMEEESGVRVDLSDNANTLTDNNTVLFGAGKIGNAADFERDTSEYLSRTDGDQTGLDITGEITLACWVKLESLPTAASVHFGIITKWVSVGNLKCYLFFIWNSDNKLGFHVSSDGAAEVNAKSNDALTTGSFIHVAATLNQTTDLMQTYINGIANGDAVAYAVNIADKASPFEIGDFQTNYYFDGLIDEAIVWNKCLTAGEVLQVKNITAYLYAGGFSGFSPWIFMKDMWEEHNKIFRPKGIIIPEGVNCIL